MASKSSFLDKVLGRLGRLDTEDLQKVVQRLAQERDFLETLFNTIEDGVLVIDREAKIIYFNHAVTRLIGLQPNVAEGRPIAEFLPELEWAKLSNLGQGGERRVVRQELEVTYPRPRFLRLFAAPWDSEKGGLALILQDATESRQETFEAIETERIQALTLLAASIAHEVGNPLNALHIHLQLLERELRRLRALKSELAVETRPGRRREKAAFQRAGEEEFEEVTGRLEKYLGVAKGEVGRLDYIVTQFLQALRPSPPQLRPASLNQTVEETVELLRPELENRRLAVELKLARHLPEAELDPPRIKQALVNLIKNSMHAMTPGGLLTLETGATAESVRVSVSDTGGGISQERLSRIFEPFYTTKKRGTGLGLMIVQRIVRDHGGRIEVESHLGKGTTFRLWFPLRERRPRLLEASTGAGAKECA